VRVLFYLSTVNLLELEPVYKQKSVVRTLDETFSPGAVQGKTIEHRSSMFPHSDPEVKLSRPGPGTFWWFWFSLITAHIIIIFLLAHSLSGKQRPQHSKRFLRLSSSSDE
jgi:hypothetical protein